MRNSDIANVVNTCTFKAYFNVTNKNEVSYIYYNVCEYILCVFFLRFSYMFELSTLYQYKLVFERKSANGISKMSNLLLSNDFDTWKRSWMIYKTPELDNYAIVYVRIQYPFISHMKRDQLNKFVISAKILILLIL